MISTKIDNLPDSDEYESLFVANDDQEFLQRIRSIVAIGASNSICKNERFLNNNSWEARFTKLFDDYFGEDK